MNHLRTIPLILGACTFAILGGLLYRRYAPRDSVSGPRRAEPLLLENEDSRCAANALMQALFALTDARGWHPEKYSCDAIAQCWHTYARHMEFKESLEFSDIDLLGNLKPLKGITDKTRYSIQGPAEALGRWLQKTLPRGSEKFAIINIHKPSHQSAAEHACNVAHKIQESGNRLPEAIMLICRYGGDRMNNWYENYQPAKYAKLQADSLQRPQLPAVISVAGTTYRLLSLVHLVQQAIPTSAAGKFIVTQAPRAWKQLKIDNSTHATACVRRGEEWFELDDIFRYKIWTEHHNGKLVSEQLATDLVLSERHPGVPAVCIYERWDGSPLTMPECPTDQLASVWSCPRELTDRFERPEHFTILHSEATSPGSPYRRFEAPRQFLPA